MVRRPSGDGDGGCRWSHLVLQGRICALPRCAAEPYSALQRQSVGLVVAFEWVRVHAQSAAIRGKTAANLRRESCDWAQPEISARSEISSVEIVNTWLGFPYICEFFQICPRPLEACYEIIRGVVGGLNFNMNLTIKASETQPQGLQL
jgi:hypothetical protein